MGWSFAGRQFTDRVFELAQFKTTRTDAVSLGSVCPQDAHRCVRSDKDFFRTCPHSGHVWLGLSFLVGDRHKGTTGMDEAIVVRGFSLSPLRAVRFRQ